MQTIRLQVSDKVYKKVLQSLNKIVSKDIRIIEENDEFQHHVAEVKEDYAQMKSGDSRLIDFEDFEKSINEIL